MTKTQSTHEGKSPSKVRHLLLPGLLVLALVTYVATDKERPLIPEAIGELKLNELLSGTAAREMINHLHAKGVTPETNEIGFYHASGGKATLYVSVYASTADAGEAEQKMAGRIRAGNPVFGRYREVSVDGVVVHHCYGMGQEHYFFSDGPRLYWLAVDASLAEPSVQDLVKTITRW